MVLALWQGMILQPLSIEADYAYFGYNADGELGSVMIQTYGGSQEVYVGEGTVPAGSISYDTGETTLAATNVQDAIDEICYMLGLT